MSSLDEVKRALNSGMRIVSDSFVRSLFDVAYYYVAGNWKGLAKIPDQSLESRESRLEPENKMTFLQFLRKTLCWLPEERPTAEELLADEWVRGDDY